MNDDADRLCPSSAAIPGAHLFGVVDENGIVEYLDKPLAVDGDFIAAAQEVRDPEQRFRFASPCLKRACGQWKDGGCSVARIISKIEKTEWESDDLPRCAIRKHCRWFAQERTSACGRCSIVALKGNSKAPAV